MNEATKAVVEALREAQSILAELTKPDMSRTAGDIYFRAVATEAKARSALSAAKAVEGRARWDALPDCMMPDGAEPCAGYRSLVCQVETLTAERDQWRQVAEALELAASRPRDARTREG